MKRVHLSIVLLAALGFAVSANAENANTSAINWTYIEGGVATFKPDNSSGQTGIFGGGSIGFGVGGGLEWGNEFGTGRIFARYNFGNVL